MRRFKIDAYDGFYGATLETEQTFDGNWVPYEDVADLDTIGGIYSKHTEISNQIEFRWRQIGGSGLFNSWKLNGDFVIVIYEKLLKYCSGWFTDKIPLKCFTESEEEAKKIWAAELTDRNNRAK